MRTSVLKKKVISRTKRRWPREFKLAAVMRMNDAASIKALAEELDIRPELLYDWHRRYRSGGADALRAIGRPGANAPPLEAPSLPSSPLLAGAEQRRIEELERKIGQQQLDLDFFRTALRHVGEQRLKKGGPGGTAFSR